MSMSGDVDADVCGCQQITCVRAVGWVVWVGLRVSRIEFGGVRRSEFETNTRVVCRIQDSGFSIQYSQVTVGHGRSARYS